MLKCYFLNSHVNLFSVHLSVSDGRTLGRTQFVKAGTCLTQRHDFDITSHDGRVPVR